MQWLINVNALKRDIGLAPDEWAKGSTIYGIINEQPAIDAEPVRHGKWMICYYNEESKEHESVTYNPYTFRNPDGAMFCSECGLDALRNVHAEHVPSAWCPHCGTVMDLNEAECE